MLDTGFEDDVRKIFAAVPKTRQTAMCEFSRSSVRRLLTCCGLTNLTLSCSLRHLARVSSEARGRVHEGPCAHYRRFGQAGCHSSG